MEITKFEEAESYLKTIRYAESILKEYDKGEFYLNDIALMLDSNKFVKRSFIRWVKNEKQIAEQEFKKI